MYTKLFDILRRHPKAWPKLVLQNKFKQEIAFSLNRKTGLIWICNNKAKHDGRLCYARVEPIKSSPLQYKLYFFASCPTNTQLGINHLLSLYLADPASYAKKYGDEECKCMFCNKKLTHPESILHGYGAVCAVNFSLPWGSAIKSAQAAYSKSMQLKNKNLQGELEL